MHANSNSATVSRGITRERFDGIRNVYGSVASWAIWDEPRSLNKSGIGNLSVLNPDKYPDLLRTLHTDIILIGLNISRDTPHPLSNFHDGSPKGMDYKLRQAAYGTDLWGSYMTDIIKYEEFTDSNELMQHLAANKGLLETNIARFRQELADIGAVRPTLVPMGGHAKKIVERAFKAEFSMHSIMHYSHYISPEDYCARVWKVFPRRNRT